MNKDSGDEVASRALAIEWRMGNASLICVLELPSSSFDRTRG
jgi:hypothetical protein